jgi:hypothetical protein
MPVRVSSLNKGMLLPRSFASERATAYLFASAPSKLARQFFGMQTGRRSMV